MSPRTRPYSLCVVTHVRHWRDGDTLRAYAPYAREIAIWADLFASVTIAAPLGAGQPPGDAAVLDARVSLAPVPDLAGRSRVGQLLVLPRLVLGLARTTRRAGALHVRCPGNLGFLGALIGPLTNQRRIAKYAGQWTRYPGEARTYRWQRRLLASRWWNAPVTVYGRWPDQPARVVPFFTSVLERAQVERARQGVPRPDDGRLRLLFVGRLSRAKNVHVLLDALAALHARGHDIDTAVLGDGAERNALEAQCASLGLDGRVAFCGAVAHDTVLEAYARADVLVLASETEGWPKAITEAMTFGLVCVGSDRGLIPEILGEGRGLVVPPGNVDALVSAISRIAADPEAKSRMGAAAAAWGARHTLEDLRTALDRLLDERWGTAELE